MDVTDGREFADQEQTFQHERDFDGHRQGPDAL